MTPDEIAIDRHQALRLENNRAIKVAALELSRQLGLGNFTVEQLAEAAQVSRRTFFNHFGSIHEAIRAGLRDILFEASETALRVIADKTRETEPDSLAQVFEASVAALQSVDFTPTITEMCTVLGTNEYDQRSNEWFGEVFAIAIQEFRTLLSHRAPHLDPIARNMMAEGLLASVRITSEVWLQQSVGMPAAQATQLWHSLFARSVTLLRSGFTTN